MIEIKNVSKTYENGNKALRNLNLTIEDGAFVFVVGRSGSGKSTLVKLLLKELEPTEGEIIVNDTPLKTMPRRYIPKYRRRLGIVFQDFRLLKDRNVYENIAFAQRVIGAPMREMKENVANMLKLTGLSSKYKSLPDQLSGGEQQRVAIARALVNKPEVLLADEPTGNLDQYNSDEIMKLLLEINRQGTTVIVITHDRDMVLRMKKRVVTMYKGQIVSDENPEMENETADSSKIVSINLPKSGRSRRFQAEQGVQEEQAETARLRRRADSAHLYTLQAKAQTETSAGDADANDKNEHGDGAKAQTVHGEQEAVKAVRKSRLGLRSRKRRHIEHED